MPNVSTLLRRRLGTSDLEVSEIGLGGNTFGPPRLDERATERVVGAALDMGVNFVDTAIVYGGGESERFLGRALGRRRDEMVIATKCNFFGLGDESAGARIQRQVDESLEKLATDRIDLYQVHFPSDDVANDDVVAAMHDLVDAGKVRAFGVCNYASWRIADTVHASRGLGGPALATVQSYYHLLARHVEAEVIPACEVYGASMLPYHPLAGGFLTGKYRRGEPAPPGTRGAAGSPIIDAMSTDESWTRLGRLEAFAADRGHQVGELAIAWLLANPRIGSVIAGVSNVEQLEANVAAASWRLTPEEKAEVDLLATGGRVPTPERPPYA